MQGVSVCLCSYNGQKFIYKQIKSILSQLVETDELIIVDDSSTDLTLDEIKKFNDERIKLIINKKNIGICKSFEKCILHSKNRYIFLSDQDDIWHKDKLHLFKINFTKTKKFLITSNFYSINDSDELIKLKFHGVSSLKSSKCFSNIIDIFLGKKNYYGCSMAFDRKLIDFLLPFPVFIESHDLWLAIVGNLMNSNYHLDENLLYKRVHENNDSTFIQRNLFLKIRSRLYFLLHILIFYKRRFLIGKN